MTTPDYHGYTGEYPDTDLKVFGMEKKEAFELLGVPEVADRIDTFMWLLETAWMRGHHAAKELNAPESENPFVHPNIK